MLYSPLSAGGWDCSTATGCSVPCMMEWDFSLEDMVASVSEVTMNKVAIAVVSLVRKFADPELPNMV
jgi:hypothetical protein